MSRDLEQEMRTLVWKLHALREETSRLIQDRTALIGEMVDAGYTTTALSQLTGLHQSRVTQLNNMAHGGTKYKSPARRVGGRPRKVEITDA